MKYIDLTLPSPAENLACDEALLDLCEEGAEHEILRFWEPAEPFVVLGYANQAALEANLPVCRDRQIGVFRRCSGGGAVLQGPGCLNYSLILRIPDRGPLQTITGANQFILQRQQLALQPLVRAPIEIHGHTDLAIVHNADIDAGNSRHGDNAPLPPLLLGERAGVRANHSSKPPLKFSGNAQRRKRHCLIFHGTFLLDFDLALIDRLLPMPSKQPNYRQNRSHFHFLTNLRLASTPIKRALREAWSANVPLQTLPTDQIRRLTQTKYSTPEWNLRF